MSRQPSWFWKSADSEKFYNQDAGFDTTFFSIVTDLWLKEFNQYVAVFILIDFLSLKNGNPSFTELSPSHFAAVCYSVSDALTLSENHENEDRLLMRSNGGIGKKNSTMVGSSQKRAASKLPRVPPPKSLRKCVLIDNDCTLHKYSLQLPLNGRKLPMQRHLTSNKWW